jgi:hypothetical protein
VSRFVAVLRVFAPSARVIVVKAALDVVIGVLNEGDVGLWILGEEMMFPMAILGSRVVVVAFLN